VVSSLLVACGNKYATPEPPDWVTPAQSSISLQVDGRSCERGCRTFRFDLNGEGLATFSGDRVESVEARDDGTTVLHLGEFEIVRVQTSPAQFQEVLVLLDEIDLFEIENAQYFEGPKIDRRHCREREPLLSVGDPRDLRQVGLDMGCPEHAEPGQRLVARLAEMTGVTGEIGAWPPDDRTSVTGSR
jgi:hypothetical protein